MTINAYDVGDAVRFSVTFQDLNGTNVDPDTVVFKTKNPAGTISTYTYGSDAEVVKDSTGKYHCDIVVGSEGFWFARWEGSGTVYAAGDTKIYVKQTEFV